MTIKSCYSNSLCFTTEQSKIGCKISVKRLKMIKKKRMKRDKDKLITTKSRRNCNLKNWKKSKFCQSWLKMQGKNLSKWELDVMIWLKRGWKNKKMLREWEERKKLELQIWEDKKSKEWQSYKEFKMNRDVNKSIRCICKNKKG